MSRLRLAPIVPLLLLLMMGCGAEAPNGGMELSNSPTSSERSPGEESPRAERDDDEPAYSDPFDDPRLVAQAPLSAAAREIQAMVNDQGFDNFGGLRLDNEQHAVVLHWKGPLPEPMAALVEELRAEVEVQVLEVPYSEAELLRELERIVRLDPEEVGFTVTGGGVLRDFTGIRVTVLSESEVIIAGETIQSPVRLEIAAGGRDECMMTSAGAFGDWRLVPGFDLMPSGPDPINHLGCAGGAAESITIALWNAEAEFSRTYHFDRSSQVRLPLPKERVSGIPEDLPLGEYHREVLVTYEGGETVPLVNGMRDTVHLVADRPLSGSECRELGYETECGTVSAVLQRPSADPVLPLFPYSPYGMGALLSGNMVVEGRCLYLISEHTGDRWLPLFPDSVSWDEGALVIRGDRFEPGDKVSIGGGVFVEGGQAGGEARDIRELQLIQEPDASCATENVWVAYLGIEQHPAP